ncbi:MAG: type I glyceraldehyde-3-phosphate dehydrogenase, partial [Rickettsiales bacterium]|nr:type I glyceraldehyde-3-phosphate dehydrogenase [Rickettsiales bacterium]
MVRIAINGLGRIGRCVIRALIENPREGIELVAVNGPAEIDTHVHLLKYDSVHGTCNEIAKKDDNTLLIAGKEVPLFRERNPSDIPWDKLNVDVVLECTGKFKSKDTADAHIKAGAKKVLISAPASDDSPMVVYGVNNAVLDKDTDILSIGSCTTNCLAPLAKILDATVGIESAFMTTIHAYTGDQNILDGSHKDLRRARAAGVSMVPTSTGAAKAVGKVIPSLQGKFDGVAIRVPTPNVSMVDLTFTAGKDTSIDELNDAMQKASESDMK